MNSYLIFVGAQHAAPYLAQARDQMTTIDRSKLKLLHSREESLFLADHAQSAALYQRAQSSLLGGVPMNWMKKWAGGESAAAGDFELERFLHLYALNRGVLLTPFHNMALVSPATTDSDIDAHTKIFASAAQELTS